MANYRKFLFPLNVYAHILLLETGKLDYLHYGLFVRAGMNIQEAQEASTGLLMEYLPAPPCALLEVGIGLGATLKKLVDNGYEVCGITPDLEQIAFATERIKGKAELTCSHWEHYAPGEKKFEAIVFQESSQYVDMLDLFTRAFDLLELGGKLILLDEVALNRIAPGEEGLHLLKHLLALAERCGFQLETRLDLSAQAAPTVDFLLEAVEKYRASLEQELGVSPEELEQLNQSNRAYREKYWENHFGYALLVFRKIAAPRWLLRKMDHTDLPAALDLFRTCFGHEMPAAMWAWKYGDGKVNDINVWKGETLVGHYGGMARKALFFGEPTQVIQIGDTMVHPSERGSLTRKGVFFRMASTFFESNVGFGKRFLASYGFPNERVMRLGKSLGLYGELDRVVELIWPVLPPFLPSWRSVLRRVSANDRHFRQQADLLWKRMAEHLQDAVVGDRGGEYLEHRYFDHPCHQYYVLMVLARFSGKPRGIVVLRPHEEDWELMDVVCGLDDIPPMLWHARRFVGAAKGKRLFGWITAAFQCHFGNECQSRDIGVSVASNISDFGPRVEEMKNRWWLTSGDTDFH